ncbi:unnamed protein product [Sphenostylis stenocarpa]|uniref:Uncharacterized protein n=1 Tax=Sphenostylis stenocarpa TaxID=92480 RepID=A0AA86S3I0_9FABA|nr:unnamed protein product [Sphenostylis stenocarpa]
MKGSKEAKVGKSVEFCRTFSIIIIIIDSALRLRNMVLYAHIFIYTNQPQLWASATMSYSKNRHQRRFRVDNKASLWPLNKVNKAIKQRIWERIPDADRDMLSGATDILKVLLQNQTQRISDAWD